MHRRSPLRGQMRQGLAASGGAPMSTARKPAASSLAHTASRAGFAGSGATAPRGSTRTSAGPIGVPGGSSMLIRRSSPTVTESLITPTPPMLSKALRASRLAIMDDALGRPSPGPQPPP